MSIATKGLPPCSLCQRSLFMHDDRRCKLDMQARVDVAEDRLARLTAAARDVEAHKNDSGSAVLSRAIDALAAILEEP